MDTELQAGYRKLSEEGRAEMLPIIMGEKVPPLTSDIISKHIFSPEAHPDRLNFLLRRVMGDSTISVASSVANEGRMEGVLSKKVIFDIPARLMDGRIADAEIQVAAQNFIFTRADLYAANMFTIQYSVEEGRRKSEVSAANVKGVVLAVFLRKSPKAFLDYNKEAPTEEKRRRYIHRTMAVLDSGLEYTPKVKIAYVQLDHALELFRSGEYNKDEDKELLLLLAAMADANDSAVSAGVADDPFVKGIINDARRFAADKEVQQMLLEERLALDDWKASREEGREEGREEMAFELVSEGMCGPDVAAGKLGIPMDDFVSRMEAWKAGQAQGGARA